MRAQLAKKSQFGIRAGSLAKIRGPPKLQRLQDNSGAASVELSDEDLAELKAAVSGLAIKRDRYSGVNRVMKWTLWVKVGIGRPLGARKCSENPTCEIEQADPNLARSWRPTSPAPCSPVLASRARESRHAPQPVDCRTPIGWSV